MGFVSDAELTKMRSAVSAVLTGTCTVKARVMGLDALGAGTIGWTSTANVACRLSPITVKNHSSEGEQFHVHAGWQIVLPHDQAVDSGDRITVGSDDYEVLTVEDATTLKTAKRALVRRVE